MDMIEGGSKKILSWESGRNYKPPTIFVQPFPWRPKFTKYLYCTYLSILHYFHMLASAINRSMAAHDPETKPILSFTIDVQQTIGPGPSNHHSPMLPLPKDCCVRQLISGKLLKKTGQLSKGVGSYGLNLGTECVWSLRLYICKLLQAV